MEVITFILNLFLKILGSNVVQLYAPGPGNFQTIRNPLFFYGCLFFEMSIISSKVLILVYSGDVLYITCSTSGCGLLLLNAHQRGHSLVKECIFHLIMS